MEHQHERRSVQPRLLYRQRFELATVQFDVVEAMQPFFRRVQHRGRSIHRDDARNERRELRAHLAGATAEIADRPTRIRERCERRERESVAEELVAEPVPLSCRR